MKRPRKHVAVERLQEMKTNQAKNIARIGCTVLRKEKPSKMNFNLATWQRNLEMKWRDGKQHNILVSDKRILRNFYFLKSQRGG
jgi:hypothetical protein